MSVIKIEKVRAFYIQILQKGKKKKFEVENNENIFNI